MRFSVVDGHCDTLSLLSSGSVDFASPIGPVSLQALRDGGVVLQFFAAYIDEEKKPFGSLCRALQLIDTFHRLVENTDNQLMPILWKEDLELLPGKRGALLAVEGGEALEGSLEILNVFFRLGVRSIGLTWNQRNLIADGSWEERSRGGLTEFGRRVVQRMQELGILVDLAHIAPAGYWDVMKMSTTPLIVSHANCRKLCDHPRNLDDTQIKELSQQGGVMGINFYPTFLSSNIETADINTVTEHIDHACQVAGSCDHVGIGSDFDGMDFCAAGIASAADYPRLWEILTKKGYSDDQVRGIAGENFLRVMKTVLPSKSAGT